MIHIEDSHSTDRALTEAEVVGSRVKHHALRPSDLGRSFLGLCEIAAANQEWHVGVSSAQRSSSLAADRAGAAHNTSAH
jgi:hypothetical protein